MDASAVAAAALAVALKDSRAAALRQVLLERERVAMSNEDVRSWVAQHVFTQSVQPPRATIPLTWAAAYEVRHENFVHVQSVLQEVRAANREGDAEHIEEILADELASSDEAKELTCVLCRRQSRDMYEMASLGRWEGLAPNERLVCGECFLLQ